jgi:uncharacterized protein YrrD
VDLGAPVSFYVLETGVPVYDAGGAEVGRVEHVLADEDADIFDGLVIDARAGFGGWRFAEGEQVAELHERGVMLAVGAEALHDVSESPGVLDVDAADAEDEGTLGHKLRRAWDLISGNY